MQKRLETFKMETKLNSIIKLLAEALYPEPDVFIRELIQNAHDGIVRRKEIAPDLDGRIDVRINTTDKTIVLQDNGIGMDDLDIKQFLSVIGSTGTLDLQNKSNVLSHELIGHFGIGFLSAFVVADMVFVETKKCGAKKAFQWRNFGSEQCELYASDKKEIGSQVVVYLKNAYRYLLNNEKIHEIIIRYCDFIKLPIYLNSKGPINAMDAPWNKDYRGDALSADIAYTDYIKHRFSDIAMDAFSINIGEDFKAKGLLYISNHQISSTVPGGLLDIFIRRMLVKKDDCSLLPSWAKFIRGAVDSPDLKPTTSRDNILMGDTSFEAIRSKLARLIVDRMIFIANDRPELFRSINERHYLHLKEMAQHYDDFFDQVSESLLFETNLGIASLKDCYAKNTPLPDGRKPIYIFSNRELAENYYHLADAKNLLVINAGRIDVHLLQKFTDRNNDKVALKTIDVQNDESLFSDLSDKERLFFEQLLETATSSLESSGIHVEVLAKYFKPINVPALIMETESTKVEERLHRALNSSQTNRVLIDAWGEELEKHPQERIHFILNADNEIIKALMELERKHINAPLCANIIRSLYHSAWLYANRSTQGMTVNIHISMLELMKEVIEQSLSKKKMERIPLKQQISDTYQQLDEFPSHIRLFLITPFDDKYRTVERAVRSIFEASPFFF